MGGGFVSALRTKAGAPPHDSSLPLDKAGNQYSRTCGAALCVTTTLAEAAPDTSPPPATPNTTATFPHSHPDPSVAPAHFLSGASGRLRIGFPRFNAVKCVFS